MQLLSAGAVAKDIRSIRLTALIHSVVSSHCALTQIKSNTLNRPEPPGDFLFKKKKKKE